MKAHISNKAQQLVAYVGDYFHGTLEPTMDWDAIADAADFSSKAGFVQSIAIWHAKHAMEYESENQAACELFFACSRDLLLYSDEDHSWLQTLSTMSYSWLQSGSQDMTEEQALEIGALVLDKLRRATAEGDPSVRYKLEMLVLKSPNLFAYCKDDLLAGRFDNDGTMVFVHDGMEASYFRHAPDLFPKESFQRKDLYAKMFGKSEFMPLHPHQIANVLAGPHATPLAWLHPLQASMQNNDARSLARSWTLATKALSQLNYDPSDEASWTL